jgi:putative MATE family efflux protein
MPWRLFFLPIGIPLRVPRVELKEKLMSQEDSKTQQNVRKHRDWTKGSLLRNLLFLSWPMVAMELLWAFSQLWDMIWIGRVGSAAIAGVGIANVVVMLLMSVDMGVTMGARAVIARCIGARDQAGANHATAQTIVIGACWGLFVTAVFVPLSENIIGLFGASPEVVAQGTLYMRTMFAGWVAMEVLVMCLYTTQSAGDTITPLLVEITIRAVHLALCPFLVLGLWIFPQLGVAGAAISNIISQVLGATILLTILLKGRTRLHLSPGDFKPVASSIWRILKIGIPALVMNLQKSIGDLILLRIISPFGTTAIAAHSIVSRVELFLTGIPLGLGAGSGVLIGQNLGADQPRRAGKTGWLAITVVESFMALCCVALLIWAEPIIGIFTTEPELIQVGSLFLRIATLGYMTLALVNVLQFAIAGAGDTLPTMIFSILMLWVVQIPLAYFLPGLTGSGVYGVRWAIAGGATAGAIIYLIYFMTGRWKKKRV